MRCVTCGLLGPYGLFAMEKLWNKCYERKNTIRVLNSNEFYSFLCFFYGILCFFYQICIKTLRKFAQRKVRYSPANEIYQRSTYKRLYDLDWTYV